MGEPLLAYDQVGIAYDGREVVNGVSFAVSSGSIVGIVGESGSGKSTLLRAALGLLGPTGAVASGDISYKGADIATFGSGELRRLRGPEVGMVFQDTLSSLTPTRRVGKLFYEVLSAHEEVGRADCARRAAGVLERLGVGDPERVLASYPFELSGGIGQRVGIGLAMILRPRLLLADEPTSALDAIAQKQVIGELVRLRDDLGIAIVLVTHNIALVRAVADDVIVLRAGHVVEQGPAARVFRAPRSPYTRGLLDATPSLRGAGA